jgi:hypothetical protein
MKTKKDNMYLELSTKNCWETSDDLAALLPKTLYGKSKGSIDRYGFFQLLAKRCKVKMPFRPFGEWVHAWMWDEHPTLETLGFSNLRRDIPVIVCNKTELKVMKNEGFSNIQTGGLPFAYVDKQHESRNAHSLLAFPPHSTENQTLTNQQSEYLDFLASLRDDFEGIFVSIFGLDWGGDLHQAAKRRGLNTVLGAHPNDLNSLYRTRSLLDAFSFVTSNTMGSHFIYALSVGCHFSFCGPKYKYTEEHFLNGDITKTHEKRLMEILSEEYLRIRFGKFYSDHPTMGLQDFKFGKSEVGIDNLLSPKTIRNTLGLSIYGQIQGVSRGIQNRTIRGVSQLLARKY